MAMEEFNGEVGVYTSEYDQYISGRQDNDVFLSA